MSTPTFYHKSEFRVILMCFSWNFQPKLQIEMWIVMCNNGMLIFLDVLTVRVKVIGKILTFLKIIPSYHCLNIISLRSTAFFG